MRRLFLFFFLASVANASYLQSGKADFATASSTVCSPGTVTAGHAIIMGVQANSVTGVGIVSTNVLTWHALPTESQAGGTVLVYYFWGFANTSGVENITVSFSSGSALIGSGCVELTDNSKDDEQHNSGTGGLPLNFTTTHNTETVVVFATSGAGSASSGVTDRQSVIFSGTTFAAIGTGSFPTAGANNIATGASGTATGLGVTFFTATVAVHNAQSQLVRRDVNEENDWVCNPTLDFICERKRAEYNRKRNGN